jgi:glutaminyl-peptide cyclotransferase
VGLGVALFLGQRPTPVGETPFDQQRAWGHLVKQVEFGPRVPNAPGHAQCRDWLVATLKPLADSVARQDFEQRVGGRLLRMSNIIGRFKGAGTGPGVLLCAHWDTRPTADYENTPERRRTPIAGANDGASGVAVLLELARLFKQKPPPVPVMIVLFDGEDYGPGIDRMFLGSRHFAARLPPDVPRRGVLLDMIGDRDLRVPQERHSLDKARAVVDEVYGVARRLGRSREFPAEQGQYIEDDHVRLQEQGLEVIDLIDFSYGPNHSWWHTLEDTPDKCSPASLEAVGDVVTEWVYGRG